MALFSECMPECARIVLDTADIVREAMLRQGIRQAYVPRVAVTPSHYSCAMNPPRCAI
jgi:hypothetical protein